MRVTLPLPHQIKVGYALRDEAGRYGVIVERGTSRNALTGDPNTYVAALWQDGQEQSFFLIDLLQIYDDIELLGMYKASRHSRGKKAGAVRFSVRGDKDSEHLSLLVPYQAGDDVPKVPQFVQHWRATYGPKPLTPEQEKEEAAWFKSATDRLQRISTGRAVYRAWLGTPQGQTFLRFWFNLEGVVRKEEYETFEQATRREVRDFLRRSGGWRQLYTETRESA